MATSRTKKNVSDRVAVLSTHVGENLVIRSNPSEEEVLGFIKEHNRRYHSGENGGPSGIPAYLVIGATFYDKEADIENLKKKGEELDISGL